VWQRHKPRVSRAWSIDDDDLWLPVIWCSELLTFFYKYKDFQLSRVVPVLRQIRSDILLVKIISVKLIQIQFWYNCNFSSVSEIFCITNNSSSNSISVHNVISLTIPQKFQFNFNIGYYTSTSEQFWSSFTINYSCLTSTMPLVA